MDTQKGTSVLTKEILLQFLAKHKLMAVATSDDFPWIASVYYSYDNDLNLYFLSSPSTLHARQILKNPKVAVAITDSHQEINDTKRGLQLSGVAHQISGIAKIKHVLALWKTSLGVVDPTLTYKAVIGSMFKITPKRIKLFDQELFKVEDGQEPVLVL